MTRRNLIILRASTLAIAAVSAIFAGPLPAKEFRIIRTNTHADPGKRPDDYPPFSHWDLREMNGCAVPWTRGIAPTPDLDSNLTADEAADQAIAQNVFAAGFGRWDAVSPSKLGFVNIFIGIPQGGLLLDGWNTISFLAMNADPGTNGATTLFRSVSTGRMIEADIVLNSTLVADPGEGVRKWTVQPDGTPLFADIDYAPAGDWPGPGDTDWNGNGIQEFQVDLQKTSTHEIGHFTGLAHIFPLGGASNDNNDPIMDQFNVTPLGPKGGGWTNITLKNEDKDGENFLYCPDLGDAPDPWMGVDELYPTKVRKNQNGRVLNGIYLKKIAPGAEHIFGIKERQPARNFTYEWLAIDSLAGNVDSECEANLVDADPYDDGVTWVPNPPVWRRPLEVTEWARYAADDYARGHNYNIHRLYGNVWMDLNRNCVWEEGGEHFLHENHQSAPLTVKNQIKLVKFKDSVTMPEPSSIPVWMRCRLDYGEDCLAPGIDSTLNLPAGAAQFGEVEDYKFGCVNRYESMWFCNPTPFTFNTFAMVVVGPSDPSDQVFAAVVDANDCPLSVTTGASNVYNVIADETTTDFPVPPFIPPFTYLHRSRCRLSGLPAGPQTTVRAQFTSPTVLAGAPPASVPFDHRIPVVNCAYTTYGAGEPNNGRVKFTVGAVNMANGGWIDGPDEVTGQFTDTLRVTVGYRVAPAPLPLAQLILCDPVYSSYPLHPVGSGPITPQDALEFLLTTPGDVPPGSNVILEVTTSWSTNDVVNHQIIEFPDPIGPPTAVKPGVPPRALALENHPNPFNPVTTIRYDLPAPASVTLAVYDVGGRLVRTLVKREHRPSGIFQTEWDGTDNAGRSVSSGVYFFRLTAGTATITRKGVLLK